MRCPSCGREVSDQAFCDLCGKPLNTEPVSFTALKSSTRSGPNSVLSTTGTNTQRSPGDAEKPTSSNHTRTANIAWALLAIVLYLVIADAAVETFMRDSPLRWWIAGTCVIYLALCSAAWRFMPKLSRRVDWLTQAALSLIVLLALLSATAWMPGGLEQGLNLLGQPTAIVLAALTAIVVALSGIFLVRLHFVPLVGKIVAGLLALYGSLAFVFAIGATSPYVSLFHGQSQWTRLPIWLQGAVVGGLFVVPLTLLLEIVTGLSRISRSKISGFAFKVLALGMSLVITIAAVRTPETYGSDVMESPPWLSTSDEKLPQGEAGYQLVSERLNRIYAALDVVNSKIDRSLFEVDALAARLGSDPATIFYFVRDDIRYEPYVGVLRGPLGTLLCRAGNSLDRSLLLAALLQKAGLTTQIASGNLNSQQAQTLVNRAFEPVKAVPQTVPSIAELAPEISKAMGIDQAKLLQLAAEMQKYSQQQNKQLMDYVDSESAYLSDLLGKAGVDAGVVTPNDQLLAEASQHYWVQYQNAGGQWVDLDSAFADAEPGKASTPIINTFAADAVPEELYHHLRITLTLRVMQVNDGQDGQTADAVLLDQELRVADQQGKDIIVANMPDPMPDLMRATGTLSDALAATKGFQTVLQLGDKPTVGKYFDLNGKVSDRLPGGEGEVASNASGIGGAFGALGGGAGNALGGAQQMSTSRIVGEWAEYKLSSPVANGGSAAVRTFHRDIVAPPAALSSASVSKANPGALEKDTLRHTLLWSAELLPVPGAVTADYSGYLELNSGYANRASLEALPRAVLETSTNTSIPRPSSRPPTRNLLLAAGASNLTEKIVEARFPKLRDYFDRPGLIAYERSVNDASGGPCFKRGYDIVSFAPRVIGHPALTTQEARQQAAVLHVTAGVLATRMEWMLVASAAADQNDINSSGASQVLEAARRQGVPAVLLRREDDVKKLSGRSVSQSLRSELSDAVAAGDAVVVPVRPVLVDGRQQVAWWLFRPESGEVVGIMPGGRGDAAEYLDMAWIGFSVFLCAADAGFKSHEEIVEHPQKNLLIFFGCFFTAAGFGVAGWGFELEDSLLFRAVDIVTAGLWHFLG